MLVMCRTQFEDRHSLEVRQRLVTGCYVLWCAVAFKACQRFEFWRVSLRLSLSGLCGELGAQVWVRWLLGCLVGFGLTIGYGLGRAD